QHGQAIVDFNGVGVRATRAGDRRADGSYDVLLGDTRTWTDFGRGAVDALGHLIVGGTLVQTLNPTQLHNLGLDQWPPSGSSTAPASQTAPAPEPKASGTPVLVKR